MTRVIASVVLELLPLKGEKKKNQATPTKQVLGTSQGISPHLWPLYMEVFPPGTDRVAF